jgi:hypothetical protein
VASTREESARGSEGSSEKYPLGKEVMTLLLEQSGNYIKITQKMVKTLRLICGAGSTADPGVGSHKR